MTRPTHPELVTRIQTHEQWVKTLREEGQQLAQQGVDLSDLDLSGRDLSTTALSYVCLDRSLLYATDLSAAWANRCHSSNKFSLLTYKFSMAQ